MPQKIGKNWEELVNRADLPWLSTLQDTDRGREERSTQPTAGLTETTVESREHKGTDVQSMEQDFYIEHSPSVPEKNDGMEYSRQERPRDQREANAGCSRRRGLAK